MFRPSPRWAIAAILAFGVSSITWMMVRSMMVTSGHPRAPFKLSTASSFRSPISSSTPLFAGRELGDRQLVRTAKDSTAMLRLADGSMVEMNGRLGTVCTAASRGTTIHLDRGDIIVHAAEQHNGALYVKTADCEVMVKGTIFAVTSGTKVRAFQSSKVA